MRYMLGRLKYCVTCWALSVAVSCVLMVATGHAASPTAHQSYRLGPNDVVRIQVYGEED